MGKEVFGIAITNSGGLHAGDTLKGTIWADFAKDTKGTALSVEFSGTEQTLVRHRREENNHPDNSAVSSDYYMRAVGKRNLILVNLPVESTSFIQANGTIPAGKYELPFTVDLPKILPSSCRAEFDGSYCEVVYRLEAEIQGSGIVQNYKAQMEVPIVAAPLTRDPIPYAVAPEMEAVTMFCCIPQGAITVAARVADTQLDQGETLNVGITGRNDSQTQISKITISLIQDCHWEAERYPMKKTDVLGSVQVDSSLVKSGTADERTLLQEVQDTTASFATPQTALPSYAGQLMRIQHCVEIVFATGMMKSNPTIRIPVQVGPAVAATTDFGDAVPEGFSGTKIDIPASNAVVLGNGGATGDQKTVEGLIRGLEASVQDIAYISPRTTDAF